MKENKLIYFLKLLPEKDLNDFRDYLECPLFNKKEVLPRLLDAIQALFLQKSMEPSKEALYRHVYGPQAFNESSLKTVMSQLLTQLREFIAFRGFRQEKAVRHRYFLQQLNELEGLKHFSTYHNQAVKSLSKAALPTSDHYYEMMLLEETLFQHQQRQPDRSGMGYIQAIVDHLGYSFLIRIFRYHLQMINHKAIFKAGSAPAFIDIAIQFIRKNKPDLPPVVQVYYTVYEALMNPRSVEYFALSKTLLNEHREKLPKLEAEELYTLVLNFAFRRLHEGDQTFLPRIFNLYEEMLEYELILEEGKLSAWHLKNLVSVALRMKKFDWVEDLIEEWKEKIFADHADNAWYYNQGLLNFFKGRFESAEKQLNTVLLDYKDPFYGLNSRGYLLQIYYETGNVIGLESLTHSFRMYLQRNKEISELKKRQYIAFISHLKKLVNIPLADTKRLKALGNEILKKDRKGMGSIWLLEKIEALLGEPLVVEQ